jgi:hydrogenase expression/formation protein HypE
MILEEGFSIAELDRILTSIGTAAHACGVTVIAGDTKVVPRGAVDGLFLNTTGVGTLLQPAPIGPHAITTGDALLVSGPIGRHGVAILAAREAFGFTPAPESDCGNLWTAVEALHRHGITPRAMRDATRGGVAAVLHEWAEACGRTLQVLEDQLPITPAVRGVCDLLGLDPLHLANEGTMVLAVQEADVSATLAVLRSTTIGSQACVIGQVVPRDIVPVVVKRVLGRTQPLDDPLGAPQPRIC